MKIARTRLYRLAKLALCLVFTLLAPKLQGADTEASPRERAVVTRVVDGDTIVVRFETGKSEHVRLIGIDTPESKPNKRAGLQARRSGRDESTIIALGKEAWRNTELLAPVGTQVELEYDVQQRDKYKRLLAYAYLPDGRMLNEEILRAGYGNLLTIAPDVRYTERFRKAYEESRTAGRGLWGKGAEW